MHSSTGYISLLWRHILSVCLSSPSVALLLPFHYPYPASPCLPLNTFHPPCSCLKSQISIPCCSLLFLLFTIIPSPHPVPHKQAALTVFNQAKASIPDSSFPLLVTHMSEVRESVKEAFGGTKKSRRWIKWDSRDHLDDWVGQLSGKVSRTGRRSRVTRHK